MCLYAGATKGTNIFHKQLGFVTGPLSLLVRLLIYHADGGAILEFGGGGLVGRFCQRGDGYFRNLKSEFMCG